MKSICFLWALGLSLASFGCESDGEEAEAMGYGDCGLAGDLGCGGTIEPEPAACNPEGLWVVGEGGQAPLLVAIGPDGTARRLDHRAPEDTCSASSGRPGTALASLLVDSVGCTLTVVANASWCFSGEQQCHHTETQIDLRGGTVTGEVRSGQCGQLDNAVGSTPVAARLDTCPFESNLEGGGGPRVEALSDVGGTQRRTGLAGVLAVAEAPMDAGPNAHRAVTLRVNAGGPDLVLHLPHPLELAVDDLVWIDVFRHASGPRPVAGDAGLVLRWGSGGVPTASDPIRYAAASGSIGSEVFEPLRSAGLHFEAMEVCPLNTYCAPEATGLAAVLVAAPDAEPALDAPAASPGGGTWLAATGERSDLWLTMHRGVRGSPTACSDVSSEVFDIEIHRWPAPTF